MDIESRISENNGPICKFGPGGDYVRSWPGGSESNGGGVGKVLAKIADFMGVKLSDVPAVDGGAVAAMGLIENNVGGNGIEHKKYKFNASTNASAGGGGKIPKEQMLFDDDSGSGRDARRRSNHGVRTHRRAKRKRTSLGQSRQGALFETNGQGAKVA